MIQPSKKLIATLEAITFIAYHSGNGPVSSKHIAAAQGQHTRYLEHILQKLVRAQILKGVRGPRGGYVLARERRRITLGEICETLAEETGDTTRECFSNSPFSGQLIRPLWQELNRLAIDHLKTIHLEALCDDARAKGIRRSVKENMDFTI